MPGRALAQFHGVSESYLLKHMQALTKAGICESVSGPSGGYRLAREPGEITLLDVVEAIEGPEPAFRCDEIRQRGPTALAPSTYTVRCGIHSVMLEAELAWKAREHPMDLSHGELTDLLAREPTNLQYRTLVQYNLTFPLAGLVLLLVGIPFVVGDERGKGGERIARGFLLCVAYFGVDFVARTLGLQGAVGPVFSGWLPLVLFGSLGAVLTAYMRS